MQIKDKSAFGFGIASVLLGVWAILGQEVIVTDQWSGMPPPVTGSTAITVGVVVVLFGIYVIATSLKGK